MVGVGVGRHIAKRHRVVGRAFDLAAGMHAVGIAVDQQAQQHGRMVCGRTPAGVLAGQLAQIELLDDLYHEPRQVIIRQPFVYRGRQQVRSVSIGGDEAAHWGGLSVAGPRLSRIPPTRGRLGKSDRLLVGLLCFAAQAAQPPTIFRRQLGLRRLL
ncbi:hypothetical protein D9M68_882280 [compost metagenome]